MSAKQKNLTSFICWLFYGTLSIEQNLFIFECEYMATILNIILLNKSTLFYWINLWIAIYRAYYLLSGSEL